MKATARNLEVLVLGTSLLLAACSGGSGGSGGAFFVTSCSLGCNSVEDGGQVGCSVTDVAVNQEIRVAFSRPVDLGSATATSFQVIQDGTGKTPPPSFRIDPNDPRVLIYRPRITFDSSGVPSFGLTADAKYAFRLAGRNQNDPGPYIRSVDGKELGGRLSCTLVASRGIADLVPGLPRVRMFVDVNLNDDPDGTPVLKTDEVTITSEPFNVFRNSKVRMVFDDLMNPAALVDQVTNQSPSIVVTVDADGDLSDNSDQVPVLGDFTIELDQVTLTTVVTFTPTGALPSRGLAEDAGIEPRRVVVNLPFSITDLAGNPLANFGQYVFVPEQILFPVASLIEDFTTNTLEDPSGSGASWNSAANPGSLRPGRGGGSGRLGALTVPLGETLTLDTDVETFSDPLFSEPGVLDFGSIIGPPVGTANPIVGGVFEFSSIELEPGAQIVLEGSNAARLLARGVMTLDGNIIASGAGAQNQIQDDFPGGRGATGGPGGGSGGDGGDRPDGTTFGAAACSGPDPDAGLPNCPPILYDDLNGVSGGGVPVPSTLNPMGIALSGEGGVAWPQPGVLPDTMMCPNCSMLHIPEFLDDTAGLPMDQRQIFGERPGCIVITPGGSGAGGGNGTAGKSGVSVLAPNDGLGNQNELPQAPVTLGGDPLDLVAGVSPSDVRSLDPELGLLRGGGGGGGGGSHIVDTRTNGQEFFNCYFTDINLTVPSEVVAFVGHSAAAGGGGGGAVQLHAGLRVILNGFVDITGGRGGGRQGVRRTPAPGGGGAGGSLLVQGREVFVSAFRDRVLWSGGSGGTGAYGSGGGDGGLGRLRFEAVTPPDLNVIGPSLTPTATQVVNMGVPLGDVVTTDVFTASDLGVSAISGAQSCWIQPEGNFFILQFQEDEPDPDDPMGPPLVPGWDMTVRIDSMGTHSWRGKNTIYSVSLATQFGNTLGASPVVVLFQGARSLAPLEDPCNVDPFGSDGIIAPGSLTGWVQHPDELNTYFADRTLRSNMVRFLVLFDRRFLAASGIQAIEDLTILAQPD